MTLIGDVQLAADVAVLIVATFAIMFTAITIAALWFAHASSKIESEKEIRKRKIDVVDKHYSDLLRIECPYCRTLYQASEPECPTCKANTKKILYPEIPE